MSTSRFNEAGAYVGLQADGPSFYVRSFQPSDQPHVLRLYHPGVLTGRINPFEHPVDLDDIAATYLQRPQDHFWVAESGRSVIGMIAISEDRERVAHLRRLRVAPSWQRDSRVAIELVRTAISHARLHGCLKLVFHTSLDSDKAVELLRRLGFQFASIRDIGNRHVIEFYDDLYANLPSQNRDGSGGDILGL